MAIDTMLIKAPVAALIVHHNQIYMQHTKSTHLCKYGHTFIVIMMIYLVNTIYYARLSLWLKTNQIVDCTCEQ